MVDAPPRNLTLRSKEIGMPDSTTPTLRSHPEILQLIRDVTWHYFPSSRRKARSNDPPA